MKTFFVTFLLILPSSFGALQAHAEASSKNTKSHLSTNIQFDGTSVRGRRQVPLGSSTVVEGDKGIPSLVDYRANYNDRILKSRQFESVNESVTR